MGDCLYDKHRDDEAEARDYWLQQEAEAKQDEENEARMDANMDRMMSDDVEAYDMEHNLD